MEAETDCFEYEGRPLKEWLLQLVEDSPPRRDQASLAIYHQVWFPYRKSNHWDTAPHRSRQKFRDNIQAIFRNSDFPTAEFVEKILSLSIQINQVPPPGPTVLSEEATRWMEQQRLKMETMPATAGEEWYLRQLFVRMPKLFPWPERKEEHPSYLAEAVRIVIGALGDALLPQSGQLRKMLNMSPADQRIATIAVSSMGIKGREFYPDLLENLAQLDPGHYLSAPFGEWLRAVPEKIPEVLRLTQSENQLVRENAIHCLGHCGRDALRASPVVEEYVLARLSTGADFEQRAWAWTLGRIATKPESIARLLDTTRPPDQPHTLEAITSLGDLGQAPDQVIPRFKELLDDLKGPGIRRSTVPYYRALTVAIEKFGEPTKVLIPDLLDIIWTEPQEFINSQEKVAWRKEPDSAAIAALGSFGTDAQAALPALREMEKELRRRTIEDGYDEDDFAFQENYLLEAIKKISGDEGSPMPKSA